MAFWKKKAKKSVDVVSPKNEKPESKTKKTRKVLPVEVRVLGAKARDLGLGAAEIAEITGAKASTVEKWARIYRDGGIEAFMQASNPGSRRVSPCPNSRPNRLRGLAIVTIQDPADSRPAFHLRIWFEIVSQGRDQFVI